MNYTFPAIYNIDDVLWAIKDSPEFIVAEKDGYKVINYVVATHETFPDIYGMLTLHGVVDPVSNMIRRECRGLVFDMDGRLINRRYHKFFNVNERDETAIGKIDWSRPHVILEKLDGSMVSPCRVRNHVRWMTKMGVTDTAMQAETFVSKHPQYALLARHYLERGYTPVFEWCSNKNRIVLDYPEDRLVLTAMRENASGVYLTHEQLVHIGDYYGVDVVKGWETKALDISVVMDLVRNQEGEEGVVVRFDDGHMVKIKSDWYVRIHKVKSLLGQERDVVKLILNNELDDMLPVLPKEDVERVEKFQKEMMDRLALCGRSLNTLVMMYQNLCDRKTFALEHAPKMNPMWRGMIFQFWDKECDEHLTYQAIVAMIIQHCGNNASYVKVKEAFLEDVDYV